MLSGIVAIRPIVASRSSADSSDVLKAPTARSDPTTEPFRFRGRPRTNMTTDDSGKLRPILAALFLLWSTTFLHATARAWGRLGHRASAKLAATLLTPQAKAAVQELLEPGESLADLSTLADEIRRDRPETGPWHYVNVPIAEPRYDRRFSSPKGCLVERIRTWRLVLSDRRASRAERREALLWIVHLVEDLHMPLHVGDRGDRGGNNLQVRFFGEGTNLHRIWDSAIIERESKDESVWVRELTEELRRNRSQWKSWRRGTAEDWATESLKAARAAYRPPGSTRELKAGAKLGTDYQRFGVRIARRRLAQAGVRLALILNEAFP